MTNGTRALQCSFAAHIREFIKFSQPVFHIHWLTAPRLQFGEVEKRGNQTIQRKVSPIKGSSAFAR
jgi:hypothetical protein